MNWFLKLIGGEALAAEAVKQAKKEWQQDLEAAIAADEADDVQQDQDISGLRVKYGNIISSMVEMRENEAQLKGQVENANRQIQDLWGGFNQHLNSNNQQNDSIDALEKLVYQDVPVWINGQVAPLKKRLDALEDATTDSDRVDPTTTDAD